jgi:hypothetical protein
VLDATSEELVGIGSSGSPTDADGSESSGGGNGSRAGASEGGGSLTVDQTNVIGGVSGVGGVHETYGHCFTDVEASGSENVGNGCVGVRGIFVVLAASDEGSRSNRAFREWEGNLAGGRNNSLSSRLSNGACDNSDNNDGIGGSDGQRSAEGTAEGRATIKRSTN